MKLTFFYKNCIYMQGINNSSLQTDRRNGIEKVLTKDNQVRFASTRGCVTSRVIKKCDVWY